MILHSYNKPKSTRLDKICTTSLSSHKGDPHSSKSARVDQNSEQRVRNEIWSQITSGDLPLLLSVKNNIASRKEQVPGDYSLSFTAHTVQHVEKVDYNPLPGSSCRIKVYAFCRKKCLSVLQEMEVTVS